MALRLDSIFLTQNPALYPPNSLRSPGKYPFPQPDSKTQRRRPAAAKIQASFEEPYGGASTGSGGENLDAFLSTLEILSLASSAAVSVYVAVRCGVQKGGGLGLLSSKVLVWQCVVLVSGLAAGAAIRRRQWRRICGGGLGVSRGPDSYGGPTNLLERVEKLEEDFRCSVTIVQALARRLEKLGIRFRVTRKALKEPIAETAALVQKNSEATRELAAQEDHLEKELGEIQKVLMAMQEQQQKQLELILAIAKAGKLWETKPVKNQDQKASSSAQTKPVKNQDQKASSSDQTSSSSPKVDGVEILEANPFER